MTVWSEKDDAMLLEAIQSGSHHAFSVLVTRHSDRFYRLAYRYMTQRDLAEDMIQAAFLKIWERPHLWKPGKGAQFTTWFYRIVVNLCLDALRKKAPLSLLEGHDYQEDMFAQDEALIIIQQQQEVDSAIQNLPIRQQSALNLCFYEGLSNKEAAEILQLSVKAVESLLMRAKATLKEKLLLKQYQKKVG